MGKLTLILGGARSGKSSFAEQMARELGGTEVVYVATAEAGDEEMQRRIEEHQQSRPASWLTLETQRNVGTTIAGYSGRATVFLVDCLTLLVSNLLMDVEDPFTPAVKDAVSAEANDLITCARRRSGHLIVVSNEVGLGLVPASPVARAYRDLLGLANQMLAQQADEVYLLIAGIPQQIKM